MKHPWRQALPSLLVSGSKFGDWAPVPPSSYPAQSTIKFPNPRTHAPTDTLFPSPCSPHTARPPRQAVSTAPAPPRPAQKGVATSSHLDRVATRQGAQHTKPPPHTHTHYVTHQRHELEYSKKGMPCPAPRPPPPGGVRRSARPELPLRFPFPTLLPVLLHRLHVKSSSNSHHNGSKQQQGLLK